MMILPPSAAVRQPGHRVHRAGPGRRVGDAVLPTHLHVTLRCGDLTCRLSLAGTLDRDSAVALGTQFEQLDRSGFDVVVFDLSELTSIDEWGEVALAELWARLRASGIACQVRGLDPRFGTSPLDLLLALRSDGPDGRVTGATEELPAQGPVEATIASIHLLADVALCPPPTRGLTPVRTRRV